MIKRLLNYFINRVAFFMSTKIMDINLVRLVVAPVVSLATLDISPGLENTPLEALVDLKSRYLKEITTCENYLVEADKALLLERKISFGLSGTMLCSFITIFTGGAIILPVIFTATMATNIYWARELSSREKIASTLDFLKKNVNLIDDEYSRRQVNAYMYFSYSDDFAFRVWLAKATFWPESWAEDCYKLSRKRDYFPGDPFENLSDYWSLDPWSITNVFFPIPEGFLQQCPAPTEVPPIYSDRYLFSIPPNPDLRDLPIWAADRKTVFLGLHHYPFSRDNTQACWLHEKMTRTITGRKVVIKLPRLNSPLDQFSSDNTYFFLDGFSNMGIKELFIYFCLFIVSLFLFFEILFAFLIYSVELFTIVFFYNFPSLWGMSGSDLGNWARSWVKKCRWYYNPPPPRVDNKEVTSLFTIVWYKS